MNCINDIFLIFLIGALTGGGLSLGFAIFLMSAKKNSNFNRVDLVIAIALMGFSYLIFIVMSI